METDSTTIDDRELPPGVADAFRAALELPEPPATLGDWADAVADRLAAADITVGPEELCTTSSSPHEARVGEDRWHFRCVFDALLLPFVVEPSEAVEVRSRSPASGAVVEARVTTEDVSVDPASAVVSLGVTTDLDAAGDLDVHPVLAYERFCPYINAFADEDGFDEWAAETPDAEATAVPLTEGFVLAGRLAGRVTA